MLPSKALGRDAHVTLYLPARFRRTASYPLLVVHDGGDFLQYASMKTVLDNLIHRLDVAETVVAFTHPGDRLAEYAELGGALPVPHAGAAAGTGVVAPARRAARRAVPAGLVVRRGRRAVGGVPVARHVRVAGADVGSFVFTDIGSDHGGGPVFDPVVKFVNRYRRSRVRSPTGSSCPAASTSS